MTISRDYSSLPTFAGRLLVKARSHKYFRLGVGVGIFLLLGLVFALIDLAPDLSHMRVTVLSGPQSSPDFRLVARLAAEAKKRHGQVVNVATEGNLDNLQRLIDADGKETLFALVLDGLDYPSPEKLELLARLPKPATIFMLSPDASRFHYSRDLMGRRIGIGPHDSGTAMLVREIFKDDHFAGIESTLSEHDFSEQVTLLKKGELDLGFFIADQDAPLIEEAVQDGLQIVEFDNAELLAAQIPALKLSTLYAGHFDAVKLLPPRDKKLYRVDRLILTERDAARSKSTALLVLLNATFKGFIDHNRSTPNATGLPESRSLERFVQDNGPSLIDQYAPRLVDFMPPANLLHYLVVVTLLFNASVVWHNFRLWRIDARRLKLEERTLQLFGEHLTIAEIERIEPMPGQFSAEDRALLDDIIQRAQELRLWVRKLSVSIVAPMGSEMLYRTQENLIYQQLVALRRFRSRLDERVAS